MLETLAILETLPTLETLTTLETLKLEMLTTLPSHDEGCQKLPELFL